jgi:hypothetical protein
MSVLLADARRRSGAGNPPPAQPAAPPAQQVAMVTPPRPAKAEALAATAEPVVAAAPQQRQIPVPLPEPRPVELAAAQSPAEPQLNWVAGPAGQQLAANVPLPPVRPGEDEPDDDEANGGPLQVAELSQDPVPQPAFAAVAQGSVPLPPVINPQRPVMADAGSFGQPLPTKLPNRALSFADPSMIPAAVAMPPKRPALIATRFEKLDFASVSAPVTSARNKAQAGLIRPDLMTVASLLPAPNKVVIMRFGSVAYQDLSPSKFSGSAIKPLRTASFATMPDLFTGSIASN